ncbi:hypothetical protein GUJ93_ZPchr0008g12764 [Zizania palustris]|uniref:Uncharacterized protein n=1 Tax=Zizania palustris TaxID=103762 RepID=A0A8J5RWM2_ZIZPA|nr:hypothetical protein GUJ93_ZPchr0008g12764 [Zizania palustris]
MADQGFRPYPPMMPAPSTAQQHVGSSSSTAIIQMAGLHSHTAYGNIDQADDGYLWAKCVRDDAAAADANAVKRLRSKLHNAECKHCERRLSAKTSGGTKHLRRHTQNHCPAKPGTIRGKQKCSAWQPDLPVSKKSKYGHQNPLEQLS